jgi:hypothetical protein
MSLPIYQHSQVYRAIWLILPLTMGVSAALLYGSAEPDADVGIAILVLSALGILLLFGRLRVELDGSHLRWRFGWLGWPRWQLQLADIQAVSKCSLDDVPGSGIKRSRSGMVYSAGGNQGLRLSLSDGRSLRLGTPQAERLCALLQARIGGG